MNRLNYIDLFSGIGGFALGAYWSGMRFDKHYFSEVNKDAIELYRKRYPDAISLGDITKVDWKALADTDRTRELQSEGCQQEKRKRFGDGNKTDWIITGGFPCQDLSVAGQGAGLEGERSGLWTAMFKAIRILRPRYVIIENVGALVGWFPRIPTGQPPDNAIHMDDGSRRLDVEQYQAIEPVLADLNSIFYDAEGQDIRAEDMGAPHERKRIWIICYPTSDRRNGWRHGENEFTTKRKYYKEDIINRKRLRSNACKTNQDVSNPDRKHGNNAGYGTSEICRERSEQTEVQRYIPHATKSGLEGQKSKGKLSGREPGLLAECNRSRPGEWLPEPGVGVLVDGLPSGLDRFEGRLSNKSYKKASQIKGIGNSIVPQIAELLFKQIKEIIGG